MTKDSDLENTDNWDVESAERRPPVRRRRVVVSVALPPDDFDKIARFAELNGMKVSEFLRESALERASR